MFVCEIVFVKPLTKTKWGCSVLSDGTQAEDKNQTEVILGTLDRGFLQTDHGCSNQYQCENCGTCPIADEEEDLLCAKIAPCQQRCSVSFWDPDSPENDWYTVSDCSDHWFADAARSSCWGWCGGQALKNLVCTLGETMVTSPISEYVSSCFKLFFLGAGDLCVAHDWWCIGLS